jgi:hypothetical protein
LIWKDGFTRGNGRMIATTNVLHARLLWTAFTASISQSFSNLVIHISYQGTLMDLPMHIILIHPEQMGWKPSRS